MGSCVSCESSVPSAKLMMEDGDIEEFVMPVKVEQILRERRRYFICDSESIAVNEYLRPINPQNELELNHLYFLLPIRKLQHRLAVPDFVALVVRAGAALKKSGYKHSRKIVPLAEDNTKGKQFYQLLSKHMGDGKDSEALKSSILAKECNSTSVDKTNTGSPKQTWAPSTWTAMLSPIPESPLNHS